MKKKTEGFLEEDLYAPVRDFLISQGYTVRAEVKDCDVAAVKDGKMIVVEMKKALSLELVMQAVKRQKIADAVYLAIPKPKKLYFTKKWRGLSHLLRRLELGLLLVTIRNGGTVVDVALEAQEFDRIKSRKQNSRRRNALEKEFHARRGDYNMGGSTRKKLMTAYRETSLYIACCLSQFGPLSPKKLRELGSEADKTQTILNMNVYGWFEKKNRGIYSISKPGKSALTEYKALAKEMLSEIKVKKMAVAKLPAKKQGKTKKNRNAKSQGINNGV
jgi:hypothetical protein